MCFRAVVPTYIGVLAVQSIELETWQHCIITYVPHIVLKGCVIRRARPDVDARAIHATFQNDMRDIS